MSFPQYESYKNSDIDWLGCLPKHWVVSALKRGFNIVGGSTPKSDQNTFWDGDIPWVTPADLGKLATPYIGTSQRMITQEGLASCGTTLVPPGSLVLSTRAPIGSLAITQTQLCTNQGCKTLVPRSGWEVTFIAYLLAICTDLLNVRGKGTTFLELSGDELGAFKVPQPPAHEQIAIVAFLDRETAKIDALVAEQQRLIELLTEKRQVVISCAVTKGLDANVPRKCSGLQWLDDVPAHWGLPAKLDDLAEPVQHSFVNGPFGSDLLTDELTVDGVPVIYIRDIRQTGYSRVSQWCVTDEKAKQLSFCRVVPGDILVAKVGDPPGLAAVYPPGEPEAIVTQDVIRLRVRDTIDANFLIYVLNSDFGREQINSISVDSTRTRVGLGQYKQLKFVLPPINEQLAIRTFLDREINRLDRLVAEAAKAISLLQERRVTLITAAVTGKIDVSRVVRADALIPEVVAA